MIFLVLKKIKDHDSTSNMSLRLALLVAVLGAVVSGRHPAAAVPEERAVLVRVVDAVVGWNSTDAVNRARCTGRVIGVPNPNCYHFDCVSSAK